MRRILRRLVFWVLGILGAACLALFIYTVIIWSFPWPVPDVLGPGVTRLTKGQVYDEYPRWSPDGTRIAFQRGFPYRPPGGVEPATLDIYLLDLDDSTVTQLTHSPEDSGAFHPTWSPDGRCIAFIQRNYLTDKSALLTIDANGSGLTSLYECPQECLYPAWSPDGKSILLIVLHQKGDEGKLYSLDLTQADPVIHKVDIPGLDAMIAPRWAWDGSELVTWVYWPAEVWIIPHSLQSAQRIDSLEGRDLVLSPTGQQLAFTTWGHGFQDGTYEYDTIQIANRDGSGAAPIPASSSNADLGQPEWSPDGTRLAFRAGGENLSHIYLIELPKSTQP